VEPHFASFASATTLLGRAHTALGGAPDPSQAALPFSAAAFDGSAISERSAAATAVPAPAISARPAISRPVLLESKLRTTDDIRTCLGTLKPATVFGILTFPAFALFTRVHKRNERYDCRGRDDLAYRPAILYNTPTDPRMDWENGMADWLNSIAPADRLNAAINAGGIFVAFVAGSVVGPWLNTKRARIEAKERVLRTLLNTRVDVGHPDFSGAISVTPLEFVRSKPVRSAHAMR
jgi:hypothetical protein